MILVCRIKDDSPGLLGIGMTHAISVLQIRDEETGLINRSVTPYILKHQGIHGRILLDTFHRQPYSLHLAGVRVIQGIGRIVGHAGHIPGKGDVLTEVVEHAPYPRLAVIGLCAAPHRETLAPKVQDEHPVVRNSTKKGTDLIIAPELAVVMEKPALHHPHRFRVSLTHGMVDFSAYVTEENGVICRRKVLIESVGSIVVISAIEFRLLLYEHPSYLCKQVLSRVENGHLREIHP